MIEEIYIAAESGGNQEKVEEVELVAGAGIVGDRNFGKDRWLGQNVTFIEQEEIEAFNRDYGQNIASDSTRRNIITKNIRLNDLVGKEFSIGEAKFRGIELCEPCANLGELLQNDMISKKEVMKAFLHKGGLRADILSSGKISVRMKFEITQALNKTA